MALLTASWTLDLVLVAVSAIATLYFFFLKSLKYWKNLNVPHIKPSSPIGNIKFSAVSDEHMILQLQHLYRSFEGEKVVGFWTFLQPTLLVRDLDVVKDVLVKEFMSFHDRGFYVNEKVDPLSAHLFSIGGVKWKNLRAKLSPTFTSGKMKMMFPIVADTSDQLVELLKNEVVKDKVVEIKEIAARFTTDVISECAFGIQTNSLKDPNAIFRTMGRKSVEPNFINALRQIAFFSPTLAKKLNMRVTDRDVSDFFLNAVKETIDYRETEKIKRNDFMQLLIELKNKGKIDDVDEPKKGGEGDNKEISNVNKFTFEETAAQAFLFFIAGFETSSTTMQFALYELALNPDLQEKAREEVKATLKKTGGKMTYEEIFGMDFLGRVIDETLRKYPPAAFLIRMSNKEYKVPDTDIVLPPETRIQIPVHAIQNDPKHFPNPERFDPDRFTEEEKSKRHHYAYLPFGDGPRNCIGMRFGLMQTRVGLTALLSNFKFEICNETPVPIKFNPKSGILAVKGGMPLKVTKLD